MNNLILRVAAKWLDQLPGGLGDKRTPSQVDPIQLEKGRKVEMEHTDDENLAREVALDHLTEDSEYYTKLEEVEKKPQ